MKKLVLLCLIGSCTITAGFAQKKDNVKLSVGAELAFPSGNLSSFQSFGIGATGQFAEKFYGHAQAGVAFLNNGGGTGFAYAPAIGFNASENFDVAVKYQAISKNGTTAYIGLRVGYSF